MKKLFIAVLGIGLLSSCKKENHLNSQAAPSEPLFTKKLKTTTYSFPWGSVANETYSYDAQGRLTVYTDDDYHYSLDYSTPGKIQVLEKDNNGINYLYEADINEKGWVTKTLQRRPDGSVYQTFKYTYNTEGYVVKEEVSGASEYINEYSVEQENIVENKHYRNNQLSDVRNYSYDNLKFNTVEWRHVGNWPGNSFGKKSRNPLKSAKVTQANGAVTWNMEYSHQTDAEHYILKETRTNKLNGQVTQVQYTYQ